MKINNIVKFVLISFIIIGLSSCNSINKDNTTVKSVKTLSSSELENLIKENRLTQKCIGDFVNDRILSVENENLDCADRYEKFLLSDKYESLRKQKEKLKLKKEGKIEDTAKKLRIEEINDLLIKK